MVWKWFRADRSRVITQRTKPFSCSITSLSLLFNFSCIILLELGIAEVLIKSTSILGALRSIECKILYLTTVALIILSIKVQSDSLGLK